MPRYRSRASAHIDVCRPTSELQAEGTSSASPTPLSRTVRPGAALSTPADARDPGASRRPPHGRAEGPSTSSDLVPKRGCGTPSMARVDALRMPCRGVLGGCRHVGDAARSGCRRGPVGVGPVSYTHLRAHETVLDLVCRL